MRLFTAIPLPERIKMILQKKLRSFPKGIRKQPVDQMHITLRFLGEASPATTETVKKRLGNIQSKAFNLSIKGAGVFPAKGKPKVIWEGVKKTKPLMNLHKKIDQVCIETGFEPESRAYVPHITVGKVKKASAKEVKKWFHNEGKNIELKMEINRFTLFESTFKSGGVMHKKIAEYKLVKPT